MRKTFAERFWSKIDKSAGPNACWPWIGGVTKDGYGVVSLGTDKSTTANRVAYILAIGPIDSTAIICHTCDNPNCCNPAHLFSGSQLDNVQDSIQKGRHSSRTSKPKTPKLIADDLAGFCWTSARIPIELRSRLREASISSGKAMKILIADAIEYWLNTQANEAGK